MKADHGNITGLLVASFIVAGLAFAGVGMTFGGLGRLVFRQGYFLLFAGGLLASIIWILMQITAVFLYRWRGLWLLTGMPLALFWPVLLALFALSVAKTGHSP